MANIDRYLQGLSFCNNAKNKKHTWSAIDDLFLLKNFNSMSIKNISQKTGFSEVTVRKHVKKLGLKKSKQKAENKNV